MGKIIGIDLGTTNSVVAVLEAGAPKVINNEEGARTTPSVVAFNEDEAALVGQIARRQSVTNTKNTIFSAKRFIGQNFNSVKEEIMRMPYKVSKANNGSVKFDVGNKSYSPPEISARILQKLKRAAENYLGEEVTSAVITVPAYFNDTQRQATKDAGKIAGLDVKRIINEPTAAALAYGLDKKEDQLIAVYDFGGGTFDISILEVGDNVVEVVATNGDTQLGGDNIDEEIIDYFISEFKKDSGIDVSEDKMVLQRFREAAEKAKIELSSTMQTSINLPFLTADAAGPKHMDIQFSRAKFEQLIKKIVEKTFKSCRAALKDAKKKVADIDEIVLVGGSTRIPLVANTVKKFFGKEPHRGVNPDEVVALGAAIQGGVLSGDVKDILLLDVIPLTLGIETLGGVRTVLIERNTTIPCRKFEIFSTAVDNQTSVEIHALQGERDMAVHNRSLGKFHLEGVPPAPRGVPQIEVSFDIDADGILKVSAKDMASGKEQSIRITNSSGLSENEIDQMVNDAKENEAEDRAKKELIQEQNQLDTLIYQTEKALINVESKLSDNEKEELTSTVAFAKATLKSDDLEAIKDAQSKLTAISHKLAEMLYKDILNETSKEQPLDSEENEDNVVDAEVVD